MDREIDPMQFKMPPEMKGRTKRYSRMTLIASLSLVAVTLCLGSVHRSIEVLTGNGGLIRITPASLLSSWIAKSGCKIYYQPKGGTAGTVVLLHNSDSQPAIVIPSADGKTLLCLYYADVCFHLLRIDPAERLKSFPRDSYLNWIVLASPWKVESGTSNDWREVSEYLKGVPTTMLNQETVTTLDFGVWRSRFDRQDLLPVVDQQIKNMQLYGCKY